MAKCPPQHRTRCGETTAGVTIIATTMLELADIHVWFADLDARREQCNQQWKLLSGDERDRASRFHFDIHRSRFIAARAMLRTILGAYLGQAPEQLTFAYSKHGKPILTGFPLHFNLSHAESGALLALTRAAPVGTDLEKVRPMADMLEITRRFFSPMEARALADLPVDEMSEAFFRVWTRKEAFVKATGEGLSCPLDSFTVSIDEPALLLRIDGDPAAVTRWSLHHLAPAAGYVGSVAIRHPYTRVLMVCNRSLRSGENLS